MKEKRRYKRILVRFPIEIIDENAKVKETIAHIRDLSEGGMRFRSQLVFEVGTALRLVLSIPDISKDMCIAAKVVWARPSTSSPGNVVGVSFLRLSKEHQTQIRGIVERIFREQKK